MSADQAFGSDSLNLATAIRIQSECSGPLSTIRAAKGRTVTVCGQGTCDSIAALSIMANSETCYGNKCDLCVACGIRFISGLREYVTATMTALASQFRQHNSLGHDLPRRQIRIVIEIASKAIPCGRSARRRVQVLSYPIMSCPIWLSANRYVRCKRARSHRRVIGVT